MNPSPRLYTPEDDATMTFMWRAGDSNAEIAEALGRTIYSVTERASRIGLPSRHRDGMDDLERLQGDRDHVAALMAEGGFTPTWDDCERRLMAMRLTRKIAA